MDDKFPIITTLCPKVETAMSALLSESKARKLNVGIHSKVRSFEKQAELYALGRTVKNTDGVTEQQPMGDIVTNSEPGLSLHNYGLAFDCVFKDEKGSWTWDKTKEEWEELGIVGEMFGLQWGGRWTMAKDHTPPDYPHFQIRPMSLKTKHIRSIVLKQGIETIWEMA